MTYPLLMLLTALLVAVFVGALLVYVLKISTLLETIGGRPTSYLAKLRLGLRAIETETGHLPAAVVGLNRELGGIAAGLETVRGHLVATVNAAVAQEGGR